MSTDTDRSIFARRVASPELLQRVLEIEGELAKIKAHFKIGFWECQCCKELRPPDWFIYRVRRDQKTPWIEPACAMCARKMFSEGPFPPPNSQPNTLDFW